ncbi:6-phosphofructokinase [Chloroflexota bacterium]
MKANRIGILSGGGDCSGINPAIKWVVKTALDERLQRERGLRYEVIGIMDGWRGLLEASTWLLNQEIVRTWDRYGGTMLGTSRTNPCNPEKDQTQTVLDNIEKLSLSAVIAIGGDDTLSIAHRLQQDGINVICIPKTIDKDLSETDYTLGFETALNVITEEIDRLRTTAGSHQRVFVVETMGRHSGWLALEGGESSGAFIILIPEFDFVPEKINELVLEGRRAGARYDIIVAAEGAKPVGGTEFVRESGLDSFGHKKLGGIAEALAQEIQQATKLETRSVNLSHLQRGGAPCAYDRRMGRYFGIAAVDLVTMSDFGKMVCFKNGRVTACPLQNVIGRASFVDIETQYDAERYNGRRTILRRFKGDGGAPG